MRKDKPWRETTTSICPISPTTPRTTSAPALLTGETAADVGRQALRAGSGSGVRRAGEGLGRARQIRDGSQPALKLGKGTILELDRKVGEAIDIYVNNRLVARGEVVLVEDRLGVTMTEIIKAGQS